jgi:DNA modification methylase
MFAASMTRMPAGYHSRDRYNPNLRRFVEQHLKERPYDAETDDYSVPAFDKPIETTKATAIYNMHTYWSKKPHDAIRQYICHYTKDGDLVLDPFCGSGGTALAALLEGRKAIAIDRSPAATFITRNYCTVVNVDELREAFEEVKRKVLPEIEWLYETRCDRCDGKALTAYTVYSQVFRCNRCRECLPLFDCIEVESKTAKGKPKKINVCPLCFERGFSEEISTRDEKLGAIPVLVSYLCKSGCKPARALRRHNDENERKREYFEKYDLGKLREIECRNVPHWYPSHKMMNEEDDSKPWGVEWREGRNFRTVAELFTKRNLWALSAIMSELRNGDSAVHDFLRFAFSATLLNVSKLIQVIKSRRSANSYYIPQVSKEIQVWESFEGKVSLSKTVSEYLHAGGDSVMISTQTAANLKDIVTNSIDYIFTDPPYAEKIQYGELNFIWEAWLDLDTQWHHEEIIVNSVRGKSETDWKESIRQAMTECYRVLKPGRWLTLCYHDTSEGTWTLVQDIMSSVGFITEASSSTLFIDTGQKSYNQFTADKVNKRDLVINFRKPKHDELTSRIMFTGEETDMTFSEKVRTIVSEYLSAHPGSAKDRIYDEVVSRMVRAGRMEPHNFDELLAQVANAVTEPVRKNLFEAADPDLFGTHEVMRWYPKEQGGSADLSDRLAEEAAANRIEQFLMRESEQQLQKTQLKLEGLQRREHELRRSIAAVQSHDPDRRAAKLGRELRETERQLSNLEAERAEWQQRALHYTYIQEFYLNLNSRPQKTLFDLLEDYFFMTEEGNWRPPQTEQEREQKAKARQHSLRHTIQRFCRLLSANELVPKEMRPGSTAIAEWIRYCKNAQLYAQGKLLYERGGLNLESLSEDVIVNVDEDYQVCVRMLARGLRTSA